VIKMSEQKFKELLRLQSVYFDGLQEWAKVYAKKRNKTSSFVSGTTEKVQDEYIEFKNRDSILKNEFYSENHEYFRKDSGLRFQVEAEYTKFENLLFEDLDTLKNGGILTNGVDMSSYVNERELRRQRGDNKEENINAKFEMDENDNRARFQQAAEDFCDQTSDFEGKTSNMLSTIRKNSGQFLISSYRSDLQGNYVRLRDIYDDLTKLFKKTSESQELQDILNSCKSNFTECYTIRERALIEMGELEEAFERGKRIHNSATSDADGAILSSCQSNYELKLPALQLTKFNGKTENWLDFEKKMSQTIIPEMMRRRWTDQDKIACLENSVEESVFKRVRHLRDQNFEDVWKALKEYYDNKRCLAKMYISKLINLKKIDEENVGKLRYLANCVTEYCAELNSLKCTFDELILYNLEQLLPKETAGKYYDEFGDGEFLTIDKFTNFLRKRIRMLETSTMFQDSERPETKKKYDKDGRSPQNSNSASDNQKQKEFCVACGEKTSHTLDFCKKFKDADVDKRAEIVKKGKSCFRCLRSHFIRDCKSQSTCKICKRKHHTLMHRAEKVESKKSEEKKEYSDKKSLLLISDDSSSHNREKISPLMIQNYMHSANQNLSGQDTLFSNVCVSSEKEKENVKENHVVLQTACILVKNAKDEMVPMRCLIDVGSQVDFITQASAEKLGLKCDKVDQAISGISNFKTSVKAVTEVEISSKLDSKFKLNLKPYVMSEVTGTMPCRELSLEGLEPLKMLELADEGFAKPAKVDILLGAGSASQISLNHSFKLKQNAVTIQGTVFGYAIFGTIPYKRDVVLNSNFVSLVSTNELLKSFFDTEAVEEVKSSRVEDDAICEQMFVSTVKRCEDGKFSVAVPMKAGLEMGNCKGIALARQLQMEKRFERNKKFREKYIEFMDDYLDNSHMEKVSNEELSKVLKGEFNFIPHHAVIREEAVTTKLRVVFEAHVKPAGTLSFNECQYIGSKVQDDIWEIMARWRLYQFAFTGDMKQMYRQIWLNKPDQNLHLIYWRKDVTVPLEVYRLKTVAYGTRSAPFLAKRVLKELVLTERQKILSKESVTDSDRIDLKALDFLEKTTYMDDLYGGADSVEEASQVLLAVIKILKSAGIELHKMAANSLTIVQDFPEEKLYKGKRNLEDETVKTLGTVYNPSDDTFQVHVTELGDTTTCIRRQLVAAVARIFDINGWLSPAVLNFKFIIREICERKLKWDDVIPDEIFQNFKSLMEEMKILGNLRIPRWFGYRPGATVELYGFCDASLKAEGACVYVRVIHEGKVQTTLLLGKTRIASINTSKKETIPRKELKAAVLLSEWLRKAADALSRMLQTKVKVFAFSDSTIVSCWIQNEGNKTEKYCMDRVSLILKRIPKDRWFHVRTNENPADCASRGLRPACLLEHDLWWHGPEFLKDIDLSEDKLTKVKGSKIKTNLSNKEIVDVNQAEEGQIATVVSADESREDQNVALVGTSNEENEVELNDDVLVRLMQRVSCFFRLIVLVVWIMRFIKYLKNKRKFLKGISKEEYNEALFSLVRYDQKLSFGTNIKKLESGVLKRLNPKYDEYGVLRADGRLKNSNLPEAEKSPMILSNKGLLATLIVLWAHKLCMHGGATLTLANVRKLFWIVKGGSLVRKVVHSCVICKRYSMQKTGQIMGLLPWSRVNRCRPFTNVGVDYAGPFTLKLAAGRSTKTHKGYVAFFVCMVTKAVDIQAVSDLSAKAFLAAFERFVAKRGCPARIYSDNGSNFVLAKKYLDKAGRDAMEEVLASMIKFFNSRLIGWSFNPPSGPNFGGLWESGIKSVKYHLKRVIGATVLTFEQFTTVLAKIEACLNSRPLVRLSDDPDQFVLTPGHFLIGDALLAPPQAVLNEPGKLTEKWDVCKRIANSFWKVWRDDYLKTLITREKWNSEERNLEVNDVVLMKNELTAPTFWPLGRVVSTHPGSDEKVRVASIKTAQGKEYVRPVSKLLPLVFTEDSETKKANTPTTGPVTRSKAKMISGVILVLLYIFGSALGQDLNREAFEITSIMNDEKIYFESLGNVFIQTGEWKLISFVNLTKFDEDKSFLIKLLAVVETECETIESDLKDNTCKILVQELKQIWTRCTENEKLVSVHQRKKRQVILGMAAAGAVGALASYLFTGGSNGDLEAAIEALNQNEQLLASVMKNKTSLIENSLAFLSQNEDTLNLNVDKLGKVMHDYGDKLQFLAKFGSFDENVLLLIVKMREYEYKQNVILSYLKKKDELKMESMILDYESFKSELKRIQNVTNLQFPRIDEKVLYLNSKVEMRISEKLIVFRIRIPIVMPDQYKLFSLTPVPIMINRNYYQIVLESRYLVMDSDKNRYQYITLEKCFYLGLTHVCKISKFRSKTSCVMDVMTNRSADDCQLRRMEGWEYWTPLAEVNRWMFAIDYWDDRKDVGLNCSQTEKVTLKMNYSVGIFQLKSHCELTLDDQVILHYDEESSQVENNFFAKMTIPLLLDENLGLLKVDDIHMRKLRNVSNLLTQLKETNHFTLKEVVLHHYTQLTLWITVLGAIAVTSFVLCCRCRRSQGVKVTINSPCQSTRDENVATKKVAVKHDDSYAMEIIPSTNTTSQHFVTPDNSENTPKIGQQRAISRSLRGPRVRPSLF
jgi:hypothetical protein